MKHQYSYRSRRALFTIALLMVMVVGCTGQLPAPTQPPAQAPSPTAEASASTGVVVESTATSVPVTGEEGLYRDDFTNPGTGWPEDQFDNYFIGYHEPEYYHVEITGSNYKTTVFEPQKKSFADATVELQVFTNSAKTAAEGDFRYGLAFRRSGDQFYAFTISQRTKKWYVLKSSPSGLTVLTEGTEESIHDLDVDDLLRVDAQGANFFFHINDRLVGEITDPDYASGEIGFYVESFDSPNTHIHFNTLTVRDVEVPSEDSVTVLYQDDFTNPGTGWTERQFDNYFIGYHEPEYYHVEITGSNYKTTVFEPEKRSFTDATVELQVFTNSAKTAAEGDFRYGLAFRRSGDQYYAFAISQRTKKWYVLKSSPNELVTLQEGTEETIHDLDVDDVLRVDAQGPNFFFHINDRLVAQVTDPDYASGEIGFYVESFDSPNTHIHFNTLTIQDVKISVTCDVNAGALYVRSGPGTTYSSLTVLSAGDTVQPLGVSPDKQWIKIKAEDNQEQAWIFNSEGFVTCNAPVDLLPTVNP